MSATIEGIINHFETYNKTKDLEIEVFVNNRTFKVRAYYIAKQEILRIDIKRKI